MLQDIKVIHYILLLSHFVFSLLGETSLPCYVLVPLENIHNLLRKATLSKETLSILNYFYPHVSLIILHIQFSTEVCKFGSHIF